ncbi:MAG TPA: hypothetical protein VJ508_07560 [Saprospiraceae bacterium]|nr:hypothetical protein [Saprospiraceae bacterium]
MANQTSQHILSASANLLGFCLFIITALHITNKVEQTKIDEYTVVISVLLASSCTLSFLSLRTHRIKLEKIFETIADYLFIASLLGILVVILFIAPNFIK